MKNGNHPLAGTYKGSRDSHIVLEMILILSKPNKKNAVAGAD